MGNCCDRPFISDELSNCKTIEELQLHLSLKMKDASTEEEELKAYLKDKKNKPIMIDVSEFKDECAILLLLIIYIFFFKILNKKLT